jgi:hypothetical protein
MSDDTLHEMMNADLRKHTDLKLLVTCFNICNESDDVALQKIAPNLQVQIDKLRKELNMEEI